MKRWNVYCENYRKPERDSNRCTTIQLNLLENCCKEKKKLIPPGWCWLFCGFIFVWGFISSSEGSPLPPLITSTPLKHPTQIDTCSNNNSPSSTLASDISKIQTEEEAEPTKDCRIVSVTDPNDIDTIIKDAERRSAELEKCKKAGINQYISPLMDCSRRFVCI